MAAGREAFTARGFEATTLSEVATAAGVSGPTVAFHFGGKDGLLSAVMDEYYEDLVARAEAVIDKPSAPLDRLTAFARFWLRALDGDFDLFAVFLAHGAIRETDSDSGVTIRAHNTRITRLFERIIDDMKAEGRIRADVSTRLVRDAFFGTAEHVLRGQVHTRRPLDHRRAADRILVLVLNGANVPQPPPTDDERLARVEAKLDQLLTRNPGAA